jgi:hypothetical protein
MSVNGDNCHPDLVVVGVGHSGTTILTQLLGKFGWNLPHADHRYAEHIKIRSHNRYYLRNHKLKSAAADVLTELKGDQPWAIKDPRFTVTLHSWIPVFIQLDIEPVLVWVKRDLDAVKQSYLRRREIVRGGPGNRWNGASRGYTVDEQWHLIQEQVQNWPWHTFEVEYEQLAVAAEMFKNR